MIPLKISFVHIGNKLPDYAESAIRLSGRHSGLEPQLLASHGVLKQLPKGIASVTALEDFYDDSYVSELRNQLMVSHTFRDGFWLRSLERLFVLEQFMAWSGLDCLFHAELDQLLFRADVLVNNLSKVKLPGLRVPFHTPELALASIMHIQGRDQLESLRNFALETEPFKNEMELLARWAKFKPERFQGLPTLASVFSGRSQDLTPPATVLDPAQTGGISDAAQVGQWVGGADPRNLPLREKPTNHFVDPPSRMLLTREQLSASKFSFEESSSVLAVELPDGRSYDLFNIHLHSKAHDWVASRPRNLLRIIDLANRKTTSSIPRVRQSQVGHKLSGAIKATLKSPDRLLPFIAMTFNKFFRYRPSSAPFLSGDTFRSLTRNVYDSQCKSIDPAKLGRNEVVFVDPELLDEFTGHILNHIQFPVTVMLGNSDLNHDDSLLRILKHSMVRKVFAQNLSKNLTDADILPIGLENRWRVQNGRLKHFRKRQPSNYPRKHRVMWAFSVHTNPNERVLASRALLKNPLAEKLENLTTNDHQLALREHAFVASPPGNGMDTHRTWEAIYQGCVPVLKKSYLAVRYWEIGLPVWVVSSYEELSGYTELELKDKYQEISPRFNSPALWIDYWRTKIHDVN